MIEDRRMTITSSARLHPDEIARRTFATARRGFQSSEVRAFLEQVGRELALAEEREQELRELLADAERRAANPVLDEATLTAALGQETARVLKSAHDAAADITTRAQSDSDRKVTEAEEEAGKLQARAEQHAADRAAQSESQAAENRRRAQDEATSRVEAARAEAASRLDAARTEADALLEQTRAECRAMLAEAQELRTRVLGDLTRRRRVLHSQIEQLRAGRERLAETIGGVREKVDRVTDELFRAEDEARMAAEAAGRNLETQHEGAVVKVGPADAAPADDVPADAASADDVHRERGGTAFEVAPEEIGVGPALEGVGIAVEQRPPRELTVEELFARLRAERESDQENDEALQSLGRAPTESLDRATTESVAEGAAAADEVAAVPKSERPEGIESVAEVETLMVDVVLSESPTRDGEELLERRDDVLDPVAATLARRLKRALTDDQNDVLDRVRAGRSHDVELLAPQEEHLSRYVDASAEPLAEAASAGAGFAGGKPDEAPAVDDIASDLAAAIVVPLRRRLHGESSAIDAGDDAFLVEQVGAAFRDWKGARIERLAGDEAIAAFSRAALAATDPKLSLRWLVDDDGAQCPDCDDNALAGPLPRGEAFPTGHPHPPAHAGCRCILAPSDA